MDWQPGETAPYAKRVLAWLHLPRNPDASGAVIATRCYLQEDEPENYGHQQRTVGCWWANGRYYHSRADKADRGYITHWMTLPEPPQRTGASGSDEPPTRNAERPNRTQNMNPTGQKTAENLRFLLGPCLREAGAGGSNPLTPTIFPRYLAPHRTVVGWFQ